jgi:hypothetical protein
MSYKLVSVAALSVLLAACGGGGGVNSTPVPTPSPAPAPTPTPTPKNTTMNNLEASETFASDAGANNLSLDLTAQAVTTASKAPGGLTIHYDAADKSYTVGLDGVTDTFLPSDVSATTSNDTRYTVNGAKGSDYLTLVSVPYDGAPAGQYVRMGYLQRNAITGSTQDTEFATFTYGLDTAAAAVPRTGSAGYQIDIFGLASTPAHEPRVFQGLGTFSTDFASGVFTEQSSSLSDYDLLTGGSVNGGGIFLNASGHLSSSDGTFSGYVVFDGNYGQIPGTLAGRFYGPSAQEIGASFSGTSSTGAAMTGSFTGTSDSSATLPNFTLTNLLHDQVFGAQTAWLEIWQHPGDSSLYQVRTYEGPGQFNRLGDSFVFAPPDTSLPNGPFDSSDIVASKDLNFTAYRATLTDSVGAPQDATLQLYKPGSANGELALTYTSFGHLSTTSSDGYYDHIDNAYFVYGIETQQFLMLGRTGTAQYNGVAYGSAANEGTAAEYDVTGTSQFNVDFSAQSMSGALSLQGTGRNGAPSIDFGRYDFSGALSGYVGDSTLPLTIGGTQGGSLTTRFYGPAGEEIGGEFSIVVPPGNPGEATQIAGVTVAKQ